MDLYADAVERLRNLCAELPEVTEENAWVGVRWKVRANTFAHVLEILDGRPEAFTRAAGTDGPATVLTFRSAEPELTALLAGDGRFFGPLWGRGDVGLVLDPAADWDELAELLVESYRLRAPKSLAARVSP
jgi:hypothetical protein